MAARTTAAPTRSPLKFFALVFALSAPFFFLGARVGRQLLPGIPLSAFGVVCPVTAAVILVYREGRGVAVEELLKRSFDYRRIRQRIWYLPILLVIPALTAVAYGVMRLAAMPLPVPQFPSLATLVMMMPVFFLAALGEELGWSGYAIDPLQERWNALLASLVVGSIWAIWHVIALLELHRSPAWIAWWCLGTVASRVILVWLYNNAGKSVFATAWTHATINVSWQLFPNQGSHWNPRVSGLVVAFAAAMITGIWRPRTLTRGAAEPQVGSRVP